MPKQSYLTKERKKLQRKAGKAIRKRYETVRDAAQERTVKAIVGTGQKAWSVATTPAQRRKAAKDAKAAAQARRLSHEKMIANPGKYVLRQGKVITVAAYTKANGTRVKGHSRAVRCLLFFVLLYLLAPATAQAQGVNDTCLLMNDDVSIVVASTMKPDEYNTLKYAMDKADMSDANFLGHLRRHYCPTELQGLDAIRLSSDAPTSDYRIVSAEQHDNRQAFEVANREYQLWLASQPQTRTITQRINDGLTEPYHYSQSPFTPSADFRTRTGRTEQVASQYLPEPTATAPSGGGSTAWRWFLSFCITGLLVVGLVIGMALFLIWWFKRGNENHDAQMATKLAGGKA